MGFDEDLTSSQISLIASINYVTDQCKKAQTR